MKRSRGQRPRGAISQRKIRELLEWQRYRCALTGGKLSPETASIDHIKPIAIGGGHVMENLQIVHRKVNHMKGRLTEDEFRLWCGRVVRHGRKKR